MLLFTDTSMEVDKKEDQERDGWTV